MDVRRAGKVRGWSRTDQVAEAYARAADYESKAYQGIDPRVRKRRSDPVPADPASSNSQESNSQEPRTYGEVVAKFVELYARPRHRTVYQTNRILTSTCAVWLNRPIAEISDHDAYELLDRFVADGKGPKAKITLTWLRVLWRWARKRKYVASPSIMDAVEIDYEKRVRDRVYSDDEIKAIWHAADKLSDPIRGAYFKLLVLLGSRKTALAAARWSDIGEEVIDSKTGKKLPIWTTPFEYVKARKQAKPREYKTPLPKLATDILSSLPKRPGDDRVFYSLPVKLEASTADRLRRHGAPADFGYHACRHTVATWLKKQKHSDEEIGIVLNHVATGTTAGYIHAHPTELKLELLDQWAAHVAALVER